MLSEIDSFFQMLDSFYFLYRSINRLTGIDILQLKKLYNNVINGPKRREVVHPFWIFCSYDGDEQKWDCFKFFDGSLNIILDASAYNAPYTLN